VLDVGHGWGGFLCSERGARGEGITLSKDQLAYVQTLIADRSLSAAVQYQDFFTHQPGRRFDGISMMGVIVAGTSGVMNNPNWEVTAYRLVLEVPADLPGNEKQV
jgi:cyclopropane fatty-acyl-phospholipid synthase-like methyltransferase